LKSGAQVAAVPVCAAAAGQFLVTLVHTLEKLFALVNDKVAALLYAVWLIMLVVTPLYVLKGVVDQAELAGV
jgi:hypothetical protein